MKKSIKNNLLVKWFYIVGYNLVLLLIKMKPKRKYKKVKS